MKIEGVVLEAWMEDINGAQHIVCVLEYADAKQQRWAFPLDLADVGGELSDLVGSTVTMEFEG